MSGDRPIDRLMERGGELEARLDRILDACSDLDAGHGAVAESRAQMRRHLALMRENLALGLEQYAARTDWTDDDLLEPFARLGTMETTASTFESKLLGGTSAVGQN